jgi:hypothetical protein
VLRGITDVDGEKIPVSDSDHYWYRDHKLKSLCPYLFFAMFEVRKMTLADREWWSNALAVPPIPEPIHPGRPKTRYLLLNDHKLFGTHLIVLTAKYNVPLFAGAPPPKEPPTSAPATTANLKLRKDYVTFAIANFTAYNAENPPVLSYSAWCAFRDDLRETAHHLQ